MLLLLLLLLVLLFRKDRLELIISRILPLLLMRALDVATSVELLCFFSKMFGREMDDMIAAHAGGGISNGLMRRTIAEEYSEVH